MMMPDAVDMEIANVKCDMVRKRQVSFARSALRHGWHRQAMALCAVLLSAGSVVAAHAQNANTQAVTVAMAPAKNTKEAEAALGLTRSQRVLVQRGLSALRFDVGAADGMFVRVREQPSPDGKQCAANRARVIWMRKRPRCSPRSARQHLLPIHKGLSQRKHRPR